MCSCEQIAVIKTCAGLSAPFVEPAAKYLSDISVKEADCTGIGEEKRIQAAEDQGMFTVTKRKCIAGDKR